MARRLYEGDSFDEEFEGYPPHRASLLCGGASPNTSRETADEEESDEPKPKKWPDVRIHFIEPADEPHPRDDYRFLTYLYWNYHDLRPVAGRTPRRPCKVCGKGKSDEKDQCVNCKMLAHRTCSDPKNPKFPLPCIPATPMADIKRPNLKECTSSLPPDWVKVPAILVKCFHELEKRITTEDLYVPLPASGKERAAIERLSAMLRRHVNRNFDGVPTQTISGCVLHFLADIVDQLYTPEEESALLRFQERLRFHDLEEILEEMKAFLMKFEHYRLHTLAAVILHLRNVFARRKENKMTSDKLYNAFQPIIKPVRVLFKLPIEFWVNTFGLSEAREDSPENTPGPAAQGGRLARASRRFSNVVTKIKDQNPFSLSKDSGDNSEDSSSDDPEGSTGSGAQGSHLAKAARHFSKFVAKVKDRSHFSLSDVSEDNPADESEESPGSSTRASRLAQASKRVSNLIAKMKD